MSVRRSVREKISNVRMTGYHMDPVGGVIMSPPRVPQSQRRHQQQQTPGTHQTTQQENSQQVGGVSGGDQGEGIVIVGNSQQAGGSRPRGTGDQTGRRGGAGQEEAGGGEQDGDGAVPTLISSAPTSPVVSGPPANPPELVRVNRQVAGVQGDQVPLAEWLDPEVPGPHPGPVLEDAEGWNLIDQWSVWDCTLCEFPTVQNIPRVYRELWAGAMSKIMRVIQSAEEGIELERGLKWFLIIPKALFRQGRRGGKAGKGLLARRVNCLVNGDWGRLLSLLDRDCRMAKMEKQRENIRERERESGDEVQMEKDRKNALLLLSKAHISKAVRTINSHGI